MQESTNYLGKGRVDWNFTSIVSDTTNSANGPRAMMNKWANFVIVSEPCQMICNIRFILSIPSDIFKLNYLYTFELTSPNQHASEPYYRSQGCSPPSSREAEGFHHSRQPRPCQFRKAIH